MAIATNPQVQTYVNERIRVRAEQVRALVLLMQDDKAAIDDVYAACSQPSPTWTDGRADGPPHLLAPADVLSYNSFITAAIANLHDAADYPTILKACVRAPGA